VVVPSSGRMFRDIKKLVQDQLDKGVSSDTSGIIASDLVETILYEWLPDSSQLRAFGEDYQKEAIAKKIKPDWADFARRFFREYM